MVYENDAERRDYGIEGESFAQQYLWSRVKVDQAPPTVAPETPAAVEHEATQFEIGSDDEEEAEADEGARAFKATIGNPPSSNGHTTATNGASARIEDPLTKTADVEEEGAEETEENTIPCLVDRLFSCTIDLLFCAGFTVPDNVRGEDRSGDKINVSRQYVSAGAAGGLTAVCHLGEGSGQHRQHWLDWRSGQE